MKPKNPAAVIDLATAQVKKDKVVLDLKGAVASIVVQLVTQATAQAIQSDGARIAVSSFLEGRNIKGNWKIHVAGMEFDAEAQALNITGLELRPVK